MNEGGGVHVISYKAIREFKAARPDAGAALDHWYRVSASCAWKSLAELKQVFGSADWVRPYVVFNVAGNKYRLITAIHFNRRKVYIRHVLTHHDYDRGAWKP